MWERNNTEGSVESRNTIKKMEDLLEKKDREDRKNNIVIKGMTFKEYGQRLRVEIEKFIEEKIKVKAEVVYARKIGKGNTIVVKLGSLEQKIDIMKNKSKLGTTDIYIENDRTIKEREIQRKIVAVAKGEKDKNKETDIKISHWKLRINGIWYKWNEYKSSLEEQVFHA